MVNVKKFLKDNADLEYAEFNKRLIKTKYTILGVRVPILRKLAKDIEPEYIELNNNLDNSLSHEEILLYIFSAGNISFEDKQIEYLQNVLPYIDNWATCDCITSSLKKMNGEKSYTFFTKLLTDEREFYVRVSVVGLMHFFLRTEKLGDILKNLKTIKAEQYYVKMAISWLLAEVCTFNFDLGLSYISAEKDKFIRNKSISKSCESYRITKEQKSALTKLRKTN